MRIAAPIESASPRAPGERFLPRLGFKALAALAEVVTDPERLPPEKVAANVDRYMGSFHADTVPGDDVAWAVNWASVRQRQLHASLTGHQGAVRAVAAVALPDGRTLLAAGGDDGSVRLCPR